MGDKQPQSNATAFAGTIASRDISFTYDHATEPALRDVTLTIPEGECIVLCGASGCGKTSYTRVGNGLIPSFFHGVFAGRQTTCGMDVETVPIDRLTPLFGRVFQNPKTQYFNANVTDELAFPAENMGLPAEEINCRIAAVTERFGIKHLLNRSIFHLSGGQKQRVTIGSALMCGGLLSHLHFQYANDLHTLVSTDEATGTETLRNPRWYATMCANEGTAEDRCAIIRALHHLQ